MGITQKEKSLRFKKKEEVPISLKNIEKHLNVFRRKLEANNAINLLFCAIY
mgnify:CR=1 FL=1